MKKILGLFSVVTMILSLIACSSDEESSGDGAEGVMKVALVCSASGQNDNGYNQSAVERLPVLAEELGIEYKVIEPTNGVPLALETLAGDGYDIIFSLEYDFDALIKGVGGADPIAEQNPDTTFVVFNDDPNRDESGSVIHKNVISVLFDVHETSYLAGYLSVLLNENHKILFDDSYNFTPLEESRGIGFIGGTKSNGILVYSYGFIEGIEKAASEYGVTYDYYAKYDAGFSDPAVGSTVSGTYYNSGANIIFADAGIVGDGITSKAKEVGKIAIQTDANLDNQQPGHVLTSVLKITGVPVDIITRAYVDGTIASMESTKFYSIATGATGLTDLEVISGYIQKTDEAQAVWAEIIQKLATVKSQIESGEIVVVDAQRGEQLDTSTIKHVNIK